MPMILLERGDLGEEKARACRGTRTKVLPHLLWRWQGFCRHSYRRMWALFSAIPCARWRPCCHRCLLAVLCRIGCIRTVGNYIVLRSSYVPVYNVFVAIAHVFSRILFKYADIFVGILSHAALYCVSFVAYAVIVNLEKFPSVTVAARDYLDSRSAPLAIFVSLLVSSVVFSNADLQNGLGHWKKRRCNQTIFHVVITKVTKSAADRDFTDKICTSLLYIIIFKEG